jgi:4-carboxymuconolactone decarboxylase
MDFDERMQKFSERYGAKGVETIARLQPRNFEGIFAELDDVDPEFTETWLNHIYGTMYNRGILDDKTRVLIIIGECTVADEMVQLETHIRTALIVGATPNEILEVILQSHIYGGNPNMCKGVRIYRRVMEELGLLEHRGIPGAL